MAIRTATLSDEDRIRQLHIAAFDDDEAELVADLAGDLLHEVTTPEILHLVAEKAGRIVGHIAFSPVGRQSGRAANDYILAPLAVDPEEQRTGIGSKLVREGLRLLAARDTGIVFVYGDPEYYGRFGFTKEQAEGCRPAFELTYPLGWQALALTDAPPVVHSETLECVKSLNRPELW